MDYSNSLLNGLYGNQYFIDHLYHYGEIKKGMVDKNGASEATEYFGVEKRVETSAKHRYTSVNICLSEIVKGDTEWESYFNYMRWNRKTISDEFNIYLEQPFMEKERGSILACQRFMDNVMNGYCNFTLDDETILNDYRHVFNMISGPRGLESVKCFQQAGRLFVNFIDILCKRYYYAEAGIKLEDIEAEANFIVDKLSSNGHQPQADTVKRAHENFVRLIEMDKAHRLIEKELLANALKLAHVRATENILQGARRIILDAISKVKAKLRDALRTAITVGSMLHPITHPQKTVKNVWKMLRNPKESVTALITWAKVSPWQFGTIVVGGLCLGAVAFSAAAIAFSIFAVDIAALVSVGVGAVIIPLSVAANQANQLIKNAEMEESTAWRKLKSFEKDVIAEGDDITAQAMDDKNDDWRNYFNKRERQAAKETLQQIAVMDQTELRQKERELCEYIPAIDDGLRDAKYDIKETMRRISVHRHDSVVLREAAEIIKKTISICNQQFVEGDINQ